MMENYSFEKNIVDNLGESVILFRCTLSEEWNKLFGKCNIQICQYGLVIEYNKKYFVHTYDDINKLKIIKTNVDINNSPEVYLSFTINEDKIPPIICQESKYCELIARLNQIHFKKQSGDCEEGIRINNVSYLNEQKEQIYEGFLILNKLYLEFHGQSVNGDKEDIEKQFCEYDKLEIFQSRLNDNSIVVNINGEVIFVLCKYNKEKELEQILKYYEEVNEQNKERIYCFEVNVANTATDLLNRENIRKMINGYFQNAPDEIFMDIVQLYILENIILAQNPKGKYTLFFAVALTLENEEEISNRITDHTVNIVTEYKRLYLDMFLKVICGEKDIDYDEDLIYSVWRALQMYAVGYYSNLWEQDYKEYFIDINSLSLEQCVKKYCFIDSIDINSQRNISLFTYYLMENQKFDDSNYFITCNNSLISLLIEEIEKKKIDNFAKMLSSDSDIIKYTIDDVDLMNGNEFENFVALLFSKMGYKSEVTKASGDQGIDIIAEKNGRKIGIQAKCYSSSVSNSAIQEVVAGIKFYNLNKAIVVTNNYFTQSASKLAEANNVVLWDRNILKEKIIELF